MAETAVKSEEPKQPDKKSRSVLLCNLGVLATGFAVVVLILSLGFVYFGLISTNRTIATAVDNVAQSAAQSQDAVTAAQKSVADMQQTIHQLQDALTTQSGVITALQKTQTTRQDNILVQEADYLIKLANDHLQFENNIPLAIRLLQTADQDISKVSDPQLFVVREAISSDLATLRSATVVDVSGVYLRLNTLNDQLDQLPEGNRFVATSEKTDDAEFENLPWWRRGLHSIAEGLQRIVVIQKNHTNDLPFVMPDQRVYLMQNLHSDVSQAKWGLLYHKVDVYRASLQQLSDWIKKYIPGDSPVTKDALATIQQLQATTIQPTSVTVESSMQAFQSYLKGK